MQKIFIKKLASRYYPKEIFIIITKNFYISIDLMCGIAGYLGKKTIPKNIIKKTLSLMKNRGPDNQNFKLYKVFDLNLYLLHSRLNIIDINTRSNQPYVFEDYAIIFNGEIYNYLEIKNKLKKRELNSQQLVIQKFYLNLTFTMVLNF